MRLELQLIVYACCCTQAGLLAVSETCLSAIPLFYINTCLCKCFVVLQHLHEEVCPKGVRHDAKVSPFSSDIGCPMAR